jgi:hypothetical protein
MTSSEANYAMNELDKRNLFECLLFVAMNQFNSNVFQQSSLIEILSIPICFPFSLSLCDNNGGWT